MESIKKGKTYRMPAEIDFTLMEIANFYKLPKIRTLIFIINKYYRYLVRKGKIAGIEKEVK